jgi:hypothetical protein
VPELRASTIRRLLQVERPAGECKQADKAAAAGCGKTGRRAAAWNPTRKTNR